MARTTPMRLALPAQLLKGHSMLRTITASGCHSFSIGREKMPAAFAKTASCHLGH
jgi:hypothetical protein